MNRLHIETTTRCILACPACPRTIWRDITKQPVNKEDLDVDLLEKFLDCAGGNQISHFHLCGDYGDSIYYPDLFELIKRFRNKVRFTIVTNGSRQTETFWNTLAGLVTAKDCIIFSIDGLEDTNHLYRINCDWPSIMMGLDIMVKSPAQVRWKTIIFKFNYDKLFEIKTFANNKGAIWHAEKTHRYGNIDLEPPQDFVEVNHVYQDKFADGQQIEIEPRCEKEAATVSASGYFYPCDWIRNPKTFYKSQLWKQKDRWLEKVNMNHNNYDQAIQAIRDWENYIKQNMLSDPGKVDVLCKMLCRKGCVTDNKINLNASDE
jgi:MoaA/NifB/PqqE/SkfB family radical SAM enzyme